jgi:hypothetical protein
LTFSTGSAAVSALATGLFRAALVPTSAISRPHVGSATIAHEKLPERYGYSSSSLYREGNATWRAR